MKEYTCAKIRNVAVVGHGQVGKTSLLESLLFSAGLITRMGSTNSGNTVSDYDQEEINRQVSIHSTLIPIEWNGFKFNFIDTPGYADFVGEAISALKIADTAVVVFDSIDGYGVGSERLWNYADQFGLAKIAYINKMDRDRADFNAVVEKLRDKFGKNLVPVQVPIGQKAEFKGLVDILQNKAFIFSGEKVTESEVPADLKDQVAAYKEMLVEAAAEQDDALLEKFMDNQEITEAEMIPALKKGVISGKIIPIMSGSAANVAGVSLLFRTISEWFPDPNSEDIPGIDPVSKEEVKREPKDEAPLSAYVFKTTIEPHVGELSYIKLYSGVLSPSSNVYNSTKGHNERVGQIVVTRGKQRNEVSKLHAGDIAALPKLKNTRTFDTLCNDKQSILFGAIKLPESAVSLGVKPKSKADQEKMGLGLATFTKEDPTFKMRYDAETKEVVVSGMGDLHIDIILKKLRERYGIEIETSAPRIPYKETVHSKAKAQGKYKKQTGGHGQYGDAWLEIEPLPRGQGFEFVNKIVGGAIPKNYIPAVEKGVREAMDGGVIAGYPVVDLKVTLYDGSYHEVDSSDLAFKIAASMGFKKAFMDAKPVMLEPIVNIEVNIPPGNVGDVVSDLNKRRGRIASIEEDKVIAQVPQAEIAKYATDLRSITHGAGIFTTRFSHYEEVLPQTQAKLSEKYKKEKEMGSSGAR